MKKSPRKLLALAAGTLALATASASAGTVRTWNFGADTQGWTVTTGDFANAGAGIEPAEANGTRAHDAAHPVAVLTSPSVSFANVSEVDNVIDVLWEGGQGNQNGDPDPSNLAAVLGYNGGNTNNAGQKGLGFRNLGTGNYDFVSYDSANGGGVETLSYTKADLVANGIDITASYALDFFTTDDGGWGWTRLNEVNLDAAALVPVHPPTDDDNDTLFDSWEQGRAGNLTDLNGAAWDGNGVTPGPGAGTGDFDGDGRSDSQEYDDGTDPTNVDSDGDGSSDGDEATLGTNPLNADSDGDGLLDGAETGTGTFVDANDTGTDPLNIDSDGDGAGDGFEVSENTDPNDALSTPAPEPGISVIWDFGADTQGWTVTNGFFANAGAGIEPAEANGTRAHDAAHPVAVLTSPPLTFRNSHMSSAVVEVAWEGGQGNQSASPDPLDLAEVLAYNGGNTNNAGQKGLGFRNLATGEYDFVSYDSANGGGVETLVYTRSDLVNNGIDINAIYELDFFTTDDGGWGWTRLNQVRIDAILNPPDDSVPPQLRIAQSGGNLNIEWDSQAGMLYNLRSDADLQPEPALWPIHGTNENIEATPPLNTLTIPLPADNELFFVIEGFPKPPAVVFEDNFDGRNDLAPWTNSNPDRNPWELGIPTAPLGPLGAFSGTNAVGTVLAGDYLPSTVGPFVLSTLRSPAIDLSGIVSGTISYQRFVDIETGFDFATVNLLDASDFSLIEELENDIDHVSLDWEDVSHPIPAAAIGKSVIFEIVFNADEIDSFQTGLVIDDFKVEGIEP